jgi:hypothetical protein
LMKTVVAKVVIYYHLINLRPFWAAPILATALMCRPQGRLIQTPANFRKLRFAVLLRWFGRACNGPRAYTTYGGCLTGLSLVHMIPLLGRLSG